MSVPTRFRVTDRVIVMSSCTRISEPMNDPPGAERRMPAGPREGFDSGALGLVPAAFKTENGTTTETLIPRDWLVEDSERQSEGEVRRAIAAGDAAAAADLLPTVYAELRTLARRKMADLPPGQTLQATALVHEAYLRLAGRDDPRWQDRWQFFRAAALAMRDILVDQARRKAARKHGGGRRRAGVDPDQLPAERLDPPVDDVLALDRALKILQEEDPRKADIVLLRSFAGLTREEVAGAIGLSVRTIDRQWRYIIARLHKEMSDSGRD
jgi:RNA polymerase sigma factor (TIGR02999 family)